MNALEKRKSGYESAREILSVPNRIDLSLKSPTPPFQGLWLSRSLAIFYLYLPYSALQPRTCSHTKRQRGVRNRGKSRQSQPLRPSRLNKRISHERRHTMSGPIIEEIDSAPEDKPKGEHCSNESR